MASNALRIAGTPVQKKVMHYRYSANFAPSAIFCQIVRIRGLLAQAIAADEVRKMKSGDGTPCTGWGHLLCLDGLALICLMSLPLAARAQSVQSANQPSAPQHFDQTTWDLTDLYPTPEAWAASYDKTHTAAGKLGQYKGTLGTSASSMFVALDAISAVRKESDRLLVYAHLKADEDTRVASEQERQQKARALRTLISEKTAWVAPEIVGLGATRVKTFEVERKGLADRFGFYLADTLRSARHTLGLEAEGVLAAAGDVLAQPGAIHAQLANSELPYANLTLPTGEKVRLDQSAYEKYRQATDRNERKEVFDAFWGTWKKFEGTVGATLTTQVMADVFASKSRKFDSALSAALFRSNMPEAVYRTLVAQTNASLPTLHRYLKMRKARLGITGDLTYYDNYPPMFPLSPQPRFTIGDSESITLAALAPLGPDYLALLRRGFAGRWMNALPRQGKAPGGYMAGMAYDVHPYLLLNHNDDYYSLSTVAHEWGHAVHTLLAQSSQPYERSGYAVFIAESASIGNEMLLNDYMVDHAKTKAQRLYFLGEGLEAIRNTFFRQVMFAEFELAIHEEVENGRPLSGARFSDMYCGLLRRYYGEAQGVMKIDPVYCLEWAFLPHFYSHFYVWQYATSMAGAAEFTDAILKQGTGARERFLNMLRAGGSDYPYEIYKAAGIDMATPAPYQALAARMNRLMDEIEALERTK
jgi:oligoendopeptidase F